VVRWRAWIATAAFGLCLAATPLRAAVAPIGAVKLVLIKTATRQKLQFVSRDPNFAFPPIGDDSDPSTGSPGGAVIHIVTPGGVATLVAPGNGASPGWRAEQASYYFASRAASQPVRAITMRQGKRLSVVTRSVPIDIPASTDTIGIRITTTSYQSCALFLPSSIRRDKRNRLLAVGAQATSLLDCSDMSLRSFSCAATASAQCNGTCPAGQTCLGRVDAFDFTTCRCVDLVSDVCSETDPVCGGTCPEGQECGSYQTPGHTEACGCVPSGSDLCGSTGAATCGGACPDGLTCNLLTPSFGANPGILCACSNPAPCGQGGYACPSGASCELLLSEPSHGLQCIPIFCGNTCDGSGSCGPGTACALGFIPPGYIGCVCQPAP